MKVIIKGALVVVVSSASFLPSFLFTLSSSHPDQVDREHQNARGRLVRD
jgi:hypothetical protein